MTRVLSYVYAAVPRIKNELACKVPLIGFSGSPWTLATYMIEGGGSKDFRVAKQFLYNHPEALRLLLERLADAVTEAVEFLEDPHSSADWMFSQQQKVDWSVMTRR